MSIEAQSVLRALDIMHSHTKLKMKTLIWGVPGVTKDLRDLQIVFPCVLRVITELCWTKQQAGGLLSRARTQRWAAPSP